jgi:hypothetical protein
LLPRGLQLGSAVKQIHFQSARNHFAS